MDSRDTGMPALGSEDADAGFPRERGSQDGDSFKRINMRLQQVTKKNQELEEKLILVTQELENEKENSRGIVLTLTERLMESRETINKLEVENMRYKRDCMLAVELLQCNRNKDQISVSSAMKKLSDYSPEPQTSTNSNKNPTSAMKQSQSTTRNANEIPANRKGVFQRPKQSRALNGKAKTDIEKVANINTTPTREKRPHQVMENEEARLIPEESHCVRDNSLEVNQGALSEHAGVLKKEGTPFVEDKPRVTEVKQSVPSKPGGRLYGQEDTPLMQGNVAMTKEDIPLVGKGSLGRKGKPYEEGDKVMEKPTETLREEVNSTHFPQKEKQMHREDKLSTQSDRTSSLEDEHVQLMKEEPSLENDRESLKNGFTPFKPKAQSGGAFRDIPQIAKDNLLTHGALNEKNKPTADGDRKLQENEKLLDDGGTVAFMKEGGDSSNAPVSDDSALLAKDGGILLTKDVDSKPLVGQVLTKEKNEGNNNALTDKDTEDDTSLAEENTPLV